MSKANCYLAHLKEYKLEIKSYLSIYNENCTSLLISNYFSTITGTGEEVPLVPKWKFLGIILDKVMFSFFTIVAPISLLLMFLKTLVFN